VLLRITGDPPRTNVRRAPTSVRLDAVPPTSGASCGHAQRPISRRPLTALAALPARAGRRVAKGGPRHREPTSPQSRTTYRLFRDGPTRPRWVYNIALPPLVLPCVRTAEARRASISVGKLLEPVSDKRDVLQLPGPP
jgi:hypothetical protein